MTRSARDLERLNDLAIDRLLGMLADEDAAEYRQLSERYPEFEAAALERAAAALHLATGIAPESMPDGLQQRLLADSKAAFTVGPDRPPAPMGRAHRWRWQVTAGLLTAAASLCIVIPKWLNQPAPAIAPRQLDVSPPQLVQSAGDAGKGASVPGNSTADAGATGSAAAADPARDRAHLLAANAHVLQRSWRAGGDPAGLQVSGDVVWDPATQTGYMRFVGLRRNEPNAEQYQLWIFDATRDERYPVDGGVFDVSGAREGDVVPIKAKLPIGVPLLFAVTIERRGGVVVSDRERIVAIASTT